MNIERFMDVHMYVYCWHFGTHRTMQHAQRFYSPTLFRFVVNVNISSNSNNNFMICDWQRLFFFIGQMNKKKNSCRIIGFFFLFMDGSCYLFCFAILLFGNFFVLNWPKLKQKIGNFLLLKWDKCSRQWKHASRKLMPKLSCMYTGVKYMMTVFETNCRYMYFMC